jgi:hypothetical protein
LKLANPILALFLILTGFSCAHAPATQPAAAKAAPATDRTMLQSLHVLLAIDPDDGNVKYFGWYDGKRNILGPGGIVSALIGMQPPELKGETTKVSPTEIRFVGIDQNQIRWEKQYRLVENTVSVTLRITSRRDQAFDAIVYSLSDLPDSTIKGDNRDQYTSSPLANAHLHADIENPHFPGEQMNPFVLRSESHHLEPGDSFEFHMTWELGLPQRE